MAAPPPSRHACPAPPVVAAASFVACFAHHEMLCIRHGYWIGSNELGIDHQPRPVTTLLPELAELLGLPRDDHQSDR